MLKSYIAFFLQCIFLLSFFWQDDMVQTFPTAGTWATHTDELLYIKTTKTVNLSAIWCFLKLQKTLNFHCEKRTHIVWLWFASALTKKGILHRCFAASASFCYNIFFCQLFGFTLLFTSTCWLWKLKDRNLFVALLAKKRLKIWSWENRVSTFSLFSQYPGNS